MALKRITEVDILTSSQVTETPHTFVEHDGAFYRIGAEDFQRVFMGVLSSELEALIAEEFSSSDTYSVGDLVIYNNTLYECITAISSAGDWDSTKWTACDVATLIKPDTTLNISGRLPDSKSTGDMIKANRVHFSNPNDDDGIVVSFGES